MVGWAIILYRYKSFMLNNIVRLSLYRPSPHRFYSVALQSGGWNNKSIPELLLEIKSKKREYNNNVDHFKNARTELKNLMKAKYLDSKLQDKSKNREMEEIIKFYEAYFDKDSGNTRAEGIAQLEGYLDEEIRTYLKNMSNIKKNIDEIQKELETKKAVEENQNTFIPIIPMYSPIIFSIFLTIFSFCISFKLIDFNLIFLNFHIPEFVIPTAITSILLFVWQYYRLYSKVRKYYKIGKIIYMFCKKL